MSKSFITSTGDIDKKAMKEAIKSGTVKIILDKLNYMWNRKGFFSVCPLSDSWFLLGRSILTFSNNTYKTLDVYHCVDWHRIDADTREGMAALVVKYLNSSRYGYNRDTQQFVDMNTVTDPSNHFVATPFFDKRLFKERLQKLWVKMFFRKK